MENLILITEEQIRACRYNGACRESIAKLISGMPLFEIPSSDLIWVENIFENQVVTSPLTVTGQVRGNWYFEASFPVKLLDANGNILAEKPAQAQGEWMTTEYVPFSATLDFANPTTDTGTLVLHNDNPSGLLQNDKELRIPIRFEIAERSVKLYYYNANQDEDAFGNIQCSRQGLVAIERLIPISQTPIQP